MKKLIINIAIIIVVFFISLFVAGSIINQGTTDMTMEMGKATFPVVTVQFNGIEMNPMHGYRKEMKTNLMRESITPLMNGRKISLQIHRIGAEISIMAFEVRSLDGYPLIENTKIP